MIRERTIGGRVVRIECASALSRQADSVLDVVERMSKAAPVEGATFRFGWSRLALVADADALRVCEPDFARRPEEEWAPTIDVTLETISAQVALLHHIGEKGEDAWLDQLLIAAPGALDAGEIYARRTPSSKQEDSGWLIATQSDPEALTRGQRLEAIAIATLVVRRRALLQVLTLPTGFTALFSGDELTEVLDGAGRPVLAAPSS